MASATHVYRNGTILTMDSGGSQAQALAVRGETILAVGSDAEIMALADCLSVEQVADMIDHIDVEPVLEEEKKE